MAFVRSVSNHPYGGAMRPIGSVYETATDDEAKLLESLKRAVRLTDQERRVLQKDTKEGRSYETRELQARQPASGIMTTGGVVQPPAPAPSLPSAPTSRAQPPRRTTHRANPSPSPSSEGGPPRSEE